MLELQKLRENFNKQQEQKFSGIELLFETNNEKYINWLEQELVKYIEFENYVRTRFNLK